MVMLSRIIIETQAKRKNILEIIKVRVIIFNVIKYIFITVLDLKE